MADNEIEKIKIALEALGIDGEEAWFSIYLDEAVTPNPVHQVWNLTTETMAEVPEFYKNREREEPVANYIAAVNPVAIKILLNYIEELEDRIDNQYDAIRNLHDSVGI